MFIYVMRNTKNNKCYVGQDSGSMSEMDRVSVHITDGKRLTQGKKLKSKSKIARAIAKYGIDCFEVKVVSHGYADKVSLDQAEIKLIAELDAMKNGYNIMPGGQGFPSNAMIDDPMVRAFLKEIRSKGAKIANANRWGSASIEDRQRWKDQLINGRTSGDWQKNIQASWDRLTEDDRQERGKQMKEGRPTRFVLLDKDEHEISVETNLRTLLANIQTTVSKKQIERVVRNDNIYKCEEFSIEKRIR